MSAAPGAAGARANALERIVLVFGIWLLLAGVIGNSQLWRQAQPPAPQLVLLGLTVGLAVTLRRWTLLREWAMRVDLRVLILVHVTRFVGFYFLVLYGRGELPWGFAVVGGWGDNVAAAGAILVSLLPAGPVRRRAALVWNTYGLVDILGVVATAVRSAAADPDSMAALLRLPLALLPLYLVPIIIVSHVLIFVRLLRRPGA